MTTPHCSVFRKPDPIPGCYAAAAPAEYTRPRLSFGRGNAKLEKTIAVFSLPAGHTCPGAEDCLAKVIGGRLVDGKRAKFRCFSASAEALFPSIRESRNRNLSLLREARSIESMAELISSSIPRSCPTVRIHVSGDFYSAAYFQAWARAAAANPDRLFYGFTKSLPIWIANRQAMPANFRLVASKGGRWDHLIAANGLVSATVVNTQADADALGLPVDHDDRFAMRADRDFALLIHGPGKAGSLQAKLHVSARQGYPNKFFNRERKS
jgi:hypothetical protein